MKRSFLLILLLFVELNFSATFRMDVQNDYLNNGFNPRVIALGNTGVIASEGSEAVFYNPSLLMDETSEHLLLSYNPYYYDRALMYGFYRLPFRYRQAIFGVGFVSDMVSGVEYRNSNSSAPDSVQTISQQDIMFAIAREIDPYWSFGLNIQFLLDNFSNNSDNINYVAGVTYKEQYPNIYTMTLRFAGTGQYMGSLGGKFQLSDRLIAYAVFEAQAVSSFSNVNAKLGVSYALTPQLLLSAGTDIDTYSCGMSYKIADGYTFHYTMSVTSIGSLHQFGIEIL